MSLAAVQRRPREIWRDPLLRALAISLALHLVFFSGLSLGGRLLHSAWLPRWVQALVTPPPPVAPAVKLPTMQARTEEPLLFVEVDPALASAEPPPDAKYYSSLSARAANPDPTRNTTTPKIDGTQTRIVKTFDTLHPEPKPAQPAQPVPETIPEREAAEARPKAKSGLTAGDLALARPQAQLRTTDGAADTTAEETVTAAPAPRPRTLLAARVQKGIQRSEKMKQDGGVEQRGQVSLDTRGTPFGVYDASLIAAVQKRWDDLLLEQKYAGDREGRVVLSFRLDEEGRISGMSVVETDVGDLLAVYCQKAVSDPSPYEKWPSDMRRMIGAAYRDLRFTFYYH